MLTRDRIVELVKDYENYPTMSYDTLADAILAEMEEPLAVLADRKGKNKSMFIGSIYRMEKGWVIEIGGLYGTTILGCKTYDEAELKAREFLSTLPDKDGEK